MAPVKAGSYEHQKSPFNTLRLTNFGHLNAQLTGCNVYSE